ncbi:hypothetical protein D3C80_1672920 [compost metagenome]
MGLSHHLRRTHSLSGLAQGGFGGVDHQISFVVGIAHLGAIQGEHPFDPLSIQHIGWLIADDISAYLTGLPELAIEQQHGRVEQGLVDKPRYSDLQIARVGGQLERNQITLAFREDEHLGTAINSHYSLFIGG